MRQLTGGTAGANQISTSTATRGRASAKTEIKNGACEMRHGTCRKSMARLSRLQLPVFSVSEWSVDQHSPADPEAAKNQNGWGGKEVDRREGRRWWCWWVVVGLALGRSQPTKPQLSPCRLAGEHDIIGWLSMAWAVAFFIFYLYFCDVFYFFSGVSATSASRDYSQSGSDPLARHPFYSLAWLCPPSLLAPSLLSVVHFLRPPTRPFDPHPPQLSTSYFFSSIPHPSSSPSYLSTQPGL